MKREELAAIIVAWNSDERLTRCLQALRASADAAGATLEAIVVDNGSTDGSGERARELGARVITNPVNAGYGVAAAQGLGLARAPWALLLNPDMVVAEAFVGALLGAASAASTDVATLVPDIRFASDNSIVNCRGVAVDDAGLPSEVEAGLLATPITDVTEVFGGSSGACLHRVESVRAVGGIEVGFFAYLEDVDLAWQLRRHGYRALLVPSAVAYHEGSASVGEGSPTKTFLVARNRRILFRLNGPHTLRARGWRAVVETGHAFVTASAGSATPSWGGRLDALRLRAYTRFVRRSRRLAGGELRAVPLAPRQGLLETLRRKRRVEGHMRHAG
jgi:GT2 family glycosyltransferase